MKHKSILALGVFFFAALVLLGESSLLAGEGLELSKHDKKVDDHAQATIDLGRQIFRFDTFGDEAWWGDTLRLHQAIAGARNGGVGAGVSPKTALAVGHHGPQVGPAGHPGGRRRGGLAHVRRAEDVGPVGPDARQHDHDQPRRCR